MLSRLLHHARHMILPVSCAALFCTMNAISVAAAERSLPDTPLQVMQRSNPITVEHDGADALGARLATRLKEGFNSSNLFKLEAKDTPKFRILISSESEFSDRPSIGSAYAVVWVFSLSDSTLRHYLAREVGILTPDNLDDLAARLIESTDNLAVRYSYLFPKPKTADNGTQNK